MTAKKPATPNARSINDRLANLATKQKVPFDSLLSYFLLERLAARLLVVESLAKVLVFKGGYISLRVYGSSRFTNDLDALLRKGKLKLIEKEVRKAIEADLSDGTWFRYVESVDLTTQGEYGGLRLSFRAGVGEPPKKIEKARLVNFDIGVGDSIVPGPRAEKLPLMFGDGELSWSVYPVENICSEKLHTLIVRGSENSRAKDVYDLSLLLKKCDVATLKKAITATFEARSDEMPSNFFEAASKIDNTVMQRGWRAAIAGIIGSPQFEECFSAVLRFLKKL